jgi:large subunit ribosomal protein L22
MEVKATAKWIRTGPRKLRKYADLVREESIDRARGLLSVAPSPAAKALFSVLNSAIANAENNHNLDLEDLRIKSILIDGAMKIPRLRPRARGRADRYYHRSCHITVVVTDEEKAKK